MKPLPPWLRSPDPRGRYANGRTTEQRFWSRLDRTGDCWLWTGPILDSGYGVLSIRHRNIRVHRYSYELLVGPIPRGLQIDHLCRVKACANPAHLEPVTNRENVLRGVSFAARQARQTHCKRGHPLSGSNLLASSQGFRVCRLCGRLKAARYLDRVRARQAMA